MESHLLPQDDDLPMRSSGEWAREKLDYLARYINVFEKAMRTKWAIRNYIDLMAGPGKNRIRGTDIVLLGSPILALTTEFPFTGYFFADLSEENTNALETRCSSSPHKGRVIIHNGDCNVVVDDVVAILQREERYSLNLAFLDPEGMELKWDTIAKLAKIRRMDLIINYPQGGLNRYMPRAFATKGYTVVDDFFGDRDWCRIFEKYQTKETHFIHRHLMDHYKQKLQALGYKEVLRDDEIGDEPLIRNAKTNAPLYRLLFASKHALGREFWQKIVHKDVHGQARLPTL